MIFLLIIYNNFKFYTTRKILIVGFNTVPTFHSSKCKATFLHLHFWVNGICPVGYCGKLILFFSVQLIDAMVFQIFTNYNVARMFSSCTSGVLFFYVLVCPFWYNVWEVMTYLDWQSFVLEQFPPCTPGPHYWKGQLRRGCFFPVGEQEDPFVNNCCCPPPAD